MENKDNYPLYPRLTEGGEIEAQKIMDSFKPRILSMVDELLGDLYVGVSMHVESDHWTNYRNQLIDGLRGYGSNSANHSTDFKELRRIIYEQNKDQIIKDLNQDLVEENERLHREIADLYTRIGGDY